MFSFDSLNLHQRIQIGVQSVVRVGIQKKESYNPFYEHQRQVFKNARICSVLRSAPLVYIEKMDECF